MQLRGAVMAAIVGGALGLVSSRLLFLQGFTLLPWGAVAVAIGGLSPTRQASVVRGLSYGFALGFLFMVGGYEGSDPIATKLAFLAALGAVSAVIAAPLSAAGFAVRVRIGRDRRSPNR